MAGDRCYPGQDDPAKGVFRVDHLRIALDAAVRGGNYTDTVAVFAGGLLGAAYGRRRSLRSGVACCTAGRGCAPATSYVSRPRSPRSGKCRVSNADLPAHAEQLDVRLIDQPGINDNLDFVLFDTARHRAAASGRPDGANPLHGGAMPHAHRRHALVRAAARHQHRKARNDGGMPSG
jgi:hypothetical protein